MRFYAKTDKGNARKVNEDSIYIPQDGTGFLAIVADGMGGHKAGEIASSIAVNTVVNLLGSMDPDCIEEKDIRKAIETANNNVFSDSKLNPEHKGMGTTITAAIFNKKGALIANVGDSRAYVLRGGELKQVTKDHSYVQLLMDNGHITRTEAENHPYKNIITRAIGSEEKIEVDFYRIGLDKGNAVMLCSDGLTGEVSEEYITSVLNSDIDSAAEKLIEAALFGAGTDNISVVIAVKGGDGA